MTDHQPQEHTFSRRNVLKYGAVASAGTITGLTAAAGTAAAQQCDITVPTDYSTIQAAVDNASGGDTICVKQGTYDEDVLVDTEVTLRGQNAPQSNNPALLDGQIDVTADGAAVRRLRITESDTFPGGTFPDPAGVLVNASDVVVENNVIEDFQADLSNGLGSFALHGVQIFGSSPVSDVLVRGNVISGFESEGDPTTWPKFGGIAGVKAQANVDNVTVQGNHITDHHSAGWVWGVVLTPSGSADGVPTDVTVEKNHIAGLNDGSVFNVFAGLNEGRDLAPYPGSAFGIDGTADADEATVKQNNLLAPNGAESKDQANTLVAKCNWWGDKSGPMHDDNPDGEGTWAVERGSAEIDYTPWLISSAPSSACIGGETRGNSSGNGNGNGN